MIALGHVWRGFGELMGIEEAWERFSSEFDLSPRGREVVPLELALGRVLAGDLRSPVEVPPAPRAAMDGYAVRAANTYGASRQAPVILRLEGEVRPGEIPRRSGDGGKMGAIRIYTGAYLPEWCDAVVPVEQAEEVGGAVEVYSQVPPWANVARPGEDVERGSVVLEGGRVLGPYELGLLAQLNVDSVEVYLRPRAALICTGDEIFEVGGDWVPGKVPNSLRYLVGSWVRERGADLDYLGMVGDDPGEIAKILESAEDGHEVILTTGGTSVGRGDLIFRAVEEIGGEVLVHGVAAMPGRPVLLARLPRGRPLIALPGYPVAAAVDLWLFVGPTLDRLRGVSGRPAPAVVEARLTRPVTTRVGMTHFVRVRLSADEGGGIWADPVRVSGSGILSSLTAADAVVVVPGDVEGLPAGSTVDALLLRRYTRLEIQGLPSP